MEVDANKALIRRFFDEVFNQQNRATANEIIAADFIAHHPAFPQGIHGPAGLMQMTAMFRGAFPDLNYRVEAVVAEDKLVAARWSATGTHQGQFLHIPATGRRISIAGMDLFRVAEGQCAEAWVNSDFLGLFQQLGAIQFPPPPA